MKKKTQLFVLSAVICIAACTKENSVETSVVSENQSEKNQKLSVTDKSNSNAETALLIRAISGNESEYEDLNNLKELLIENAPLKDEILSKLIATKRISNELVELLTMLSLPIKKNIIAEMKHSRPDMDLENVIENQFNQVGKQIRIIYSNPISIIMGSELEHVKPNVACGDCSSIITGSSDTRLIVLKELEDVIRPMRSKNCDPQKNECGLAVTIKVLGGRETRPKYEVTCDTSVDKVCIGGKANN